MKVALATLFLVFFLLILPLHGQDALEHARAVNLERFGKLPNFVADESAQRYQSPATDPPKWKFMDTTEAEIAVEGQRFTRRNTRLNGKPWTKPSFPNFGWSPRFGSELRSLFDPKCPVTIEFEGRQEFHGRLALAYRFHAPPDACFDGIVHSGIFGAKRVNPARTGRFLIEDPGGDLVQYEEQASEFPKGFETTLYKESHSWDYVKIGDASYLLPVAFEIFFGNKHGLWRATAEYKNHRHFGASTDVTFQTEEPPK